MSQEQYGGEDSLVTKELDAFRLPGVETVRRNQRIDEHSFRDYTMFVEDDNAAAWIEMDTRHVKGLGEMR